MKEKWIGVFSMLIFLTAMGNAQEIKTTYVRSFGNSNHPQVAYWFFATNMMEDKAWKDKIDSLAAFSKYTLIFLTDRGADFYDTKTMHPIFKKLVAYAHQKGLKIALQVWKSDVGILLENTDRLMQEGEVQLDENGAGQYTVKANGARDMDGLIKSELFKIYAFKKTSEGFYDSATLREITPGVKTVNSKEQVSLTINTGSKLKGYTAYVLTQHYYKSCSNFSEQAKSILINAFKAYADIPFDGIGLDEYKSLKIARQKILEQTNDVFRERLYSLGMAKQMKAITGMDLDKTLFDMRYAPAGKSFVRIKAINEYMSLLRTVTLSVEAAMYDVGKKMYGKDAFIGLHSTFHNNLDMDEVWQTGVSWWNIKRDYGHTDENTSTAIQMGIGMSYRKNAMYNMYYDRSLEKIWTKALNDLRFGVRTHYHAANDGQAWGVSIETPEALQQINKVENAARMLNRFNPSFPKIKLLVIYGMEAMYNWYPNLSDRGMYDINDHLGFEKKSIELWNNGYLNSAVPTDLVEDGRLSLNAAGKPTMNGHVFDAIIFLNPQYARKTTTTFIQNYIAEGGKLLIEGNATNDFYGNDITKEWENIKSKATATSFSLSNVEKLGIAKNILANGVANEDGSYTFTSVESIKTNSPAVFSFTLGGNIFSGTYKGLAAIKVDAKGNLQKLSATAFSSLTKNGKEILHVSREADVFITMENGGMNAVIADETKSIKINQNR
ncbi:MAG: hypothetical protein JWP81_2749 [Ferruginibacter sp.]|nr:hypothetical protein [Ferruginibacter sp.]